MTRTFAMALPVLALLLLAAHFYRAALWPLAMLSLASIALAYAPQRWAAHALRLVLLLGAFEWLRTAWALAAERAASGRPYARLLVILGVVAAVTLVAGWFAGRHRPENSRDSGAV